ncbi:MAG: hypothetical protein EP343_07065 [Deltaproteobacteria bacterium]|nr:MAG: hypothetical protein EP343_07065 [Deltaproteobacteria bacterium]
MFRLSSVFSTLGWGFGLWLLGCGVSASVYAQANLVMKSWTADLNTAQGAGTPVTFTFEVENKGNKAAGAFDVAFYYGDSTSFSNLTLFATYKVTSLDAGKTTGRVTVVGNLPSNVAWGVRALHYYIDPTRVVPETSDGDNYSNTAPRYSRRITITGLPDIQVEAVRVVPTDQVPNGTIQVGYRLYNAGYSRVTTYFDTYFYDSVDNRFQSTTDKYLGQYQRLSSLNARTHWPSSTGYSYRTFKVPANAAVGDRYVVVRSDATSRIVNEISETNNYGYLQYKVVSQKPELSLTLFSAATTVNGYNEQRTITYTAKNSGTAASGDFNISFYYGNSTSTSGLVLLGTTTVKSLDPGKDTGRVGYTITMPDASVYGTRYLHYFVDSGGKVSEINETNNRSYRAISVRGLPNLQVTALSAAPTTQVPSGELRMNFTVSNWNKTGATRNTVETTLRFYYSADASLNTRVDTYIGQLNIPAIWTGKSYSGAYTVKLPNNAAVGARYIFAYADIANKQRESVENDNFKSTPVTVGRAIGDLEMATWNAPATSDGAGKVVPIAFTIRNRGNADTTPHSVAFHYGDSTTRSGLALLGTAQVPTLRAGQTHQATINVTLPGVVLLGKRAIHYTIDNKAEVSESSETNNVGSRTLTITGKPNLQVEALSVTPLQQTAGGDVRVVYRVVNKGLSRASANTQAQVYVSNDATLTPADTALRTLPVTPLAVGETYPQGQPGTVSVTLPSNLGVGKVYVGVLADQLDAVDETSETDNGKSVEVAIVANVPDLTVGTWSIQPTTATGSGDAVSVTFTVKNTGKADAGAFSVAFFYGDTTARTNLSLLGQANVAGLKAGATSASATVSLTLPKEVLTGQRYVHLSIDPSDQVGEFTESNNNAFLPLTLTGKPNLKIDTYSVSPSQQVPGGKVTITYRVTNDGKTKVGATKLGVYLSADSNIDAKDTLLASMTLPALDSGASHPASGLLTLTVTLPSTLQTGTPQTLGIWADHDFKIAETTETDNIKSSLLTIVSTISDLVMASLAINPTQTSGSKNLVTVEYRIQNVGTQDAVGFDVSFYYGDTDQPQSLVLLGTDSIRRVDAQTTDSKRSLSLTLPASVKNGERFVHFWIDSKVVINEKDETNNRGSTKLSLTGLPNLQVSTYTVQPLTQDQGKDIQFTYRIYNAGVTQSEETTVQIALVQGTYTKVLWQEKASALDSQAFDPSTGNKTMTLRLPQGLPAGTYDLTFSVDPDNKIKELLETDNAKKVSFVVKPGKPDLKPVAVSVQPNQQKATQSVTVDYKIQNLMKTDAASFRVGLYFSADAQFDSSDTLMHTFNVSGIKGEQEAQGKETFTLPSTLVGGKGALFLVVNDDKKLLELDDTNNALSTALEVYVDKDKDGVYSDTDCNDNDNTVYPGAPELCDGKDNNCNQKIDDDPRCVCKTTDPPRPCYSGGNECQKQQDGSYQCQGLCKPGKQSCIGGQWGNCVGETKPEQELCDGKDNNCDGKVDENLTRQCFSGKAGCTLFQDGFYRCDGPCRAGLQNCSNGAWGVCVGDTTPTQEVCDGKDNDCDGQVDNQVASSQSLERPCQSSCGPGVEVCLQTGQWGACVPAQPCERNPDGPSDGGSSDGPPPDADCYLLGCPLDQICQKGQCVNDPCRGVQCNNDEFCREGSCVLSCNCTSCQKGEVCVNGSCKSDPCAGVSCSSGEVCDPQTSNCVEDRCATVNCGVGQVCKSGTCVDDPCTYINCPQGQVCRNGQCVGSNCPTESAEEEPAVTESISESAPKEFTQDAGVTKPEEPTSAVEDEPAAETTSVVDKNNTPEPAVNTELPPVPEGCGCQQQPNAPLFWMLLMMAIGWAGVRRWKIKGRLAD